MIRSLILAFSFAASLGIAWNRMITVQKKHKPVLSGTWICDNHSVTSAQWLTRKDTMELSENGTYTWKQGTALESGKWKFLENKELQLFDRTNTFYQQLYHTRETSILHIPVAGLNEEHLELNFYSDDQSRDRFYTKRN